MSKTSSDNPKAPEMPPLGQCVPAVNTHHEQVIIGIHRELVVGGQELEDGRFAEDGVWFARGHRHARGEQSKQKG